MHHSRASQQEHIQLQHTADGEDTVGRGTGALAGGSFRQQTACDKVCRQMVVEIGQPANTQDTCLDWRHIHDTSMRRQGPAQLRRPSWRYEQESEYSKQSLCARAPLLASCKPAACPDPGTPGGCGAALFVLGAVLGTRVVEYHTGSPKLGKNAVPNNMLVQGIAVQHMVHAEGQLRPSQGQQCIATDSRCQPPVRRRLDKGRLWARQARRHIGSRPDAWRAPGAPVRRQPQRPCARLATPRRHITQEARPRRGAQPARRAAALGARSAGGERCCSVLRGRDVLGELADDIAWWVSGGLVWVQV